MKGTAILIAGVVIFVASTGMLNTNAISGPVADFTWQPENPTDLDSIHFIDNSSGDIVIWVWYFGDGNSSTDVNPYYKYADNGTYNVTLIVIDSNGIMNKISKEINVSNVPPHALMDVDAVNNHSNVSFSSLSYDDDGSVVLSTWNFGDGSTATGKDVVHTYSSDGIYNITLVVKDNDGAENETNSTIMVDTTAPETSYNLSCNGWCNETVDVTLSASDNLSGVNKTYYKIDDGAWNVYNNTFSISSEGIHKIYFYSTDNAGNVEEIKNTTVKIDKTKPYTSININATYGKEGWCRTSPEVTLTASDNLSGVNKTYYKIDDGAWNVYNNTFSISSEGIHKIYFYSTDNAGNVEEIKNTTVKIDKTKPSVSIDAPKKGYINIAGRAIMPTLLHHTFVIGKFNAEVTATDSGSGVDYVEFILNGNLLWRDYVSPYSAYLPRDFPASIGNKLKVIAYDIAGNSQESEEITYMKIL